MSRTGPNKKILAVLTVDIMAWKLLRPWFRALQSAGYQVHIACAPTGWFEQLAAEGFCMHEVPLRRRVNPFLHIAPAWLLYRLIRRERFALVNTHSPVAAMVGRMSAWLGRCRSIVYTVHGFYFHENMPALQRRCIIALERLMGRVTTAFMFVSDEDRLTAIREGIVRNAASAVTIYNGVDLDAYPPKYLANLVAADLRRQLNIPPRARVIGTVGRIVREKGYIEFAEMAELLSASRPEVYFLVVGDALPSDRDGIVAELRRRVEAAGLLGRFRFTGFTDQVSEYLCVMEIFVLPSYREGFPRSVLEAMSSALPVVTTNIRGCREAVVDGETGILVPPRDGTALAEAVRSLLDEPDLALRMGSAGRERAVRLFSQRAVQERFVDAIRAAMLQANPGAGPDADGD